VQRGHNIGYLLHRVIVDCEQKIALLQANGRRGRVVRNLGRDDPFRRESPQNAVFHFAPCRA
jgi:hypothetical protein